MSVASEIKERALAFGYDSCGIIRIDALKGYAKHLDERIERFPHSRHLYEGLYALFAPERKRPWAKSVVVGVRSYNKYKVPKDAARYFAKVYLFDGRLEGTKAHKAGAAFEEYLRSLGAELAAAVVPARWAAVEAGLGRFGKNNFLYTRNGSWVWVDTWAVSLELEYDSAVTDIKPCPKSCTKCIDACPTGALCEPFAMDRGACIVQSALFSAELPPEPVRERMGTWLYGCDVCQDVCPRNKKRWTEEEEFDGLDELLDLLYPEKLAEMDEATFLSRIQPRFGYVGKEAGWVWKANAIRAMANSGDPAYHGQIRQARQQGDDRVREMANWACRKLGI